MRCIGNRLTIDTRVELANGDGLSFTDGKGQFSGARVNRVIDRGAVLLRENADIPRGTRIYRTADKAFNDLLAKPSATRVIAVDAHLRYTGNLLILTLADESGNRVTHSVECGLQAAAKPQGDRQKAELGKLGGTVYRLREALVPGNVFIPASLLASLRRETVERLNRARAITRQVDKRRSEDMAAACPATVLLPADNVANRLAKQLYRDHGVKEITPALETGVSASADTPFMHTRYCLRRQLGACLKGENAQRLPRDLYLKTGGTLLRVTCDCTHCEMLLTLPKAENING